VTVSHSIQYLFFQFNLAGSPPNKLERVHHIVDGAVQNHHQNTRRQQVPQFSAGGLRKRFIQAIAECSNELFAPTILETALSNPEDSVATDLNSLLSSAVRLEDGVEKLSKQLESIENAIETIGNIELRSRLEQSTKLSRETLSKAMLELFQMEEALRCCSV
jgi:hypothetical protein